jgi:MOSC domain-containing protein YiiM
VELGSVDSLYIGPEEGGPVSRVDSVVAVAGRGLEGDRYFHTVDGPHDPSLEITLIEVEPLERAPEEHGLDVEPVDMRRNIVTRGVTLRDLIGKEFTVGEVRIEALEDNPPCRHLVGLVGKPVLKPLIDKGGVRGRIVTSGTIRPGDVIAIDDQNE